MRNQGYTFTCIFAGVFCWLVLPAMIVYSLL